MKRYASYKYSGVEWLGDVPTHWKIPTGSHVGRFSKGSGIRKDEVVESGLPCIRYGQIYTTYNHSVVKTVSFINQASSESSVSVESGTLLLTGSGETKADIGKCVVYYGSEPVWVGGDIIILQPSREYDPFYLTYLINSEGIRIQKEILSKGEIVVHIYQKNFGEMRFVMPPLPEQQAIVYFLDEKTSQIDELIYKKEKKIELLKEYRTSLINKVVTKGLDPNVPMKDAGVEWVGEIPSHWKCVKTNKVFFNLGSGTTPSSDNSEYYEDGTHCWITTTDLNEGIVTDTLSKLSDKCIADYPNLTLYPKYSVYISMYGGRIGKIGLSTFESYCNQSVCVLPNNETTSSKFYYYWYLSNQEQLKQLGRGGGQPNINKEMIKEFLCVKLPLTEQQSIVDFLDRQTMLLDSYISSELCKIELLKEFRQSLISSVVTGKVKVFKD